MTSPRLAAAGDGDQPQGPASDGARIAVVDYGMGNRRSVEKALEHAGARALVTADSAEIRAADGLVLCGVGAFAAGAQRLRESGLDDLVRERVADGTPLLGICLGMQLLFERSDERGGATGLGLLAGPVRQLQPSGGLKLPHIGWNLVRWVDRPDGRPPVLRGTLPEQTAFYHVHSYVVRPEDPADVAAHGDYGGPFVTAVQRDRVYGAQFHPEKSSTDGLRVLRSFAETCTRCTT
ncbi:Imidazole glycerol phosphate synthase amidotransferase subunit [Patulibacter medicamentivorans]|uniref:Imidazole glycerol phosphate synthase subunit HisH n=1 Tax=Patulibacter medicamentivorans TaxID=1097667 RepID=H0E796_9ACTN|nr:imidazole glycerol phosphate synthase subunit HisH [Patulibacter medicamentivorans]EHN10471.1 Imidazole glycerol phosphate synthase amidotransferase subunit [Patulibacter medicamentivorans]